MGHIRETVYVHAPVEKVWEFLIDYKRYPEWQVNLLDIKDFTGIPGEPGFNYKVVYKALGRRIEGTFQVTKSEKPRFLEEKGHMPGQGEMTTTSVLEATPDGGTAFTFTADYELRAGFLGSLVDKVLFERSVERDVRSSNETFKELIEASTPVFAR